MTDARLRGFLPRVKENFCIIVVGMILENDRVLLVQEAKQSCRGKFFVPAGRLEVDETLTDGVKREVKEESGFDFRPTRIVLVETNGPFWISVIFDGEVVGGSVKTAADEESLGARWFSLNEVRETELLKMRDPYNHVCHTTNHKQLVLRAPIMHMVEAVIRFRSSQLLHTHHLSNYSVGTEAVGCVLYRLGIVWMQPDTSAHRPSHLLLHKVHRSNLPTFRLNGGHPLEAISLFLRQLFTPDTQFITRLSDSWDRRRVSLLDLVYTPRSQTLPPEQQADSLILCLRVVLWAAKKSAAVFPSLPVCVSDFAWFPTQQLDSITATETSDSHALLQSIALPMDSPLLPMYM